jgi:outer membrane biosynthesis protein TonB
MSKKIEYAYCEQCRKEVEEAVKKPLSTMQKTIWIIAIVGTLGIAAIIFVFYTLYFRTKDYCPTCFTKLQYSREPFIKPEKKKEPKTPKEQILEKVKDKEEPEEIEVKEVSLKKEKKKKPKEKKPKPKKKDEKSAEKELICPFCGEKLDEEYATCPFCRTALKF